jgi:hypothetical protein
MKLETAEFIGTYFLTLEEYLHETETSHSLQFFSDIFIFIYVISIANVSRIYIYVVFDSEVNFTFIICT